MKIGLMIATEGELEAFLKSGEGIRKENRAGKKVYITDTKSDADIVVYYTRTKSEACWQNRSKSGKMD